VLGDKWGFLLLGAQYRQGVYPRRASSGEVARHEPRCREQSATKLYVSGSIGRTSYSEADRSRVETVAPRSPIPKTDQRQNHALANYEPENVPPPRAQREPNTDLSHPLGDVI